MSICSRQLENFVLGPLQCSVLTFLVLLALALSIGPAASAEEVSVDDVLARPGCAMAHCDPGMSDNSGKVFPLSYGVVGSWRDTDVNGSLVGLGCVANDDSAVCSFRSSSSRPIEIRAYDPDGVPRWGSQTLSSRAFYSSPIIGPNGDVVAVDERNIVRFGSDGSTVWSKATAGGNPISPNVTQDGHLILATKGGPVSAYDFETGDLVAQLQIEDRIRLRWRTRSVLFDTVNTPAVSGNRIYISTRSSGRFRRSGTGRLYAIDLVRDSGSSGYALEIAWYYEFRAPSGTSPTLSRIDGKTVIFFDGAGATPSANDPAAIAVMDMGDRGELLWSYSLSSVPQMSPALDPRPEGGIWYLPFESSQIVRLSEEGGNEVQRIDFNDIIDESSSSFRPFSVMTLATDADSGNPVMIVAATNSNESITYVVAIDLSEETLLWKYQIDEGRGFYGGVSGQFAMTTNVDGDPVLVFSTRRNGAWGLILDKGPAR
ncbi:PQQ-binding-like beta-propeller repeat protein [Myxococcota bacterium]|nr:PQQ-binding-like beta-propeller repeat protein [Myxococcota bacterium]